jgi:hypothetical protein
MVGRRAGGAVAVTYLNDSLVGFYAKETNMSASNEWFEYHLTPNGWVDGSEKIDFAGTKSREVPEDRVLTVEFRDYLSSTFSKPELTVSVTWRHENSQLVTSLLDKHGKEPHPGWSRFNGWQEI